MRRNHIPPYDQIELRSGVLVVDGFGFALKVHRVGSVFAFSLPLYPMIVLPSIVDSAIDGVSPVSPHRALRRNRL